MPIRIGHYSERAFSLHLRQTRKSLNLGKTYIMDFAKHAPSSDMPKLSQIWESIPRHLAKENKKFVYGIVKKSARAREYESALTWLENAGLIYRAKAVETVKYPLKHYADTSGFKTYALDVGLLGAMSQTPVELLVQGNKLFNEYQGAFVENYVAQQLIALNQPSLYDWRSKGGKAELDFLYEFSGKICPLEVKAGVNLRSKSLQSYDTQFSPPTLARTTLLNFKKDGKILNIPLYAISALEKLTAESIQ